MNILKNKTSIIRLAFAIVLASISLISTAGKITSNTSGFGGWDFSNIDVILNGTDSTFDYDTGAYSFSADSDLTYESLVYDDTVNSTLLGKVLAKDWPVGEPAGIKVVNDDPGKIKEGKPNNCIISTSYLEGYFLDSLDPQPVVCSSDFQSHKRYKLAMLPSSVVSEHGIDLVFNVEPEDGSRDYQVFQKINNWTDGRLAGFTIEVGQGIGGNFELAGGPGGIGLAELSLSAPITAWDSPSQNANFSAGLFGPLDKHTGTIGFFDLDTRAGFVFDEYGATGLANASGQTDTLTSGATLGSDYGSLFGNWLPDSMLPYGIFYDDDNNPDTDAQLMAWYGKDEETGELAWMTGASDNFALVADATVTEIWGNDPLYSMGEIDDLVNVGLNYIVTVGNVTTFTIRITPIVETVVTDPPAYVGITPSPLLGASYNPPTTDKNSGWVSYMAGTSWITIGILGLGILLRRKSS